MSTVVLLNKPYGVICQFSASGTLKTLKDFVAIPGVYPAGRLDTDSEGLVVLTDDGSLQHRISDPRHKLPKTYYVEVEGTPDEAALATLRAGVQLSGYRARPAEVGLVAPPHWIWPRVPPIRVRMSIPTAWLQLTLREGRNRQVRHMTAAVGFPTLRLIRYSIGSWSLAELAPGTWKTADPSILPHQNDAAGTPTHPPRRSRVRRQPGK